MIQYPFKQFFFQTITRCCQVHPQATSLFKNISIGMFQWEAIFVTFRVWLHEKQLGPFEGDILLTRMLLIGQTSFIFILCLCDQGRWRAYRYLVFWSKMGWKKLYKHFSQPGKTDLRMHIHQFKLTKI